MGESNYHYFVISTSLVLIFAILTIVLTALYFTGYKTNNPSFEIENFFLGFQVLICCGSIMATVQLLSWHIYFWKRGITTFTHIHFQRAKQEKLHLIKQGYMSQE